MKQHISIEQLNELTNKEKVVLKTWWQPQKYDFALTFSELQGEGNQIAFIVSDYGYLDSGYRIDGEHTNGYRAKNDLLPLFSIGQMIEFLGDDWIEEIQFVAGGFDDIYFPKAENLCDALWEAVRETLEK